MVPFVPMFMQAVLKRERYHPHGQLKPNRQVCEDIAAVEGIDALYMGANS